VTGVQLLEVRRAGQRGRPPLEYLEARRRLGMPSRVYAELVEDQAAELAPGHDDTGTCEACGQPMTLLEPGQRFHPTCEPAEIANPLTLPADPSERLKS
jgi:hypothetical protein